MWVVIQGNGHPRQPKLTIQEQFEAFDQRHPEVYVYLLALSRELLHKGWKRFGLRCLWERARWCFHIEKNQAESYKLDDHYAARYVRKIIKEHPEFDGFFELRKLRTK